MKAFQIDDLALTQMYEKVNCLRPGVMLPTFREDIENCFGFAHLPQPLKDHVHSVAYERGHSGGYSEVLSEYGWILETIESCVDHLSLSTGVDDHG